MRILSVSAQKPDSTGSGVYLSEIVKELDREGHRQAVLAGVYEKDQVSLPDQVTFFPVYFKTEKLPFPIPGMSDQMPYESTIYSTMDEEMITIYMQVFREKIREAVEVFRPDLILCHHLYLVTALVRDCVPDIPVYGFCHNTDLRQMKKHKLQQKFIQEKIGSLDRIYALHKAQVGEILGVYPVEKDKIHIAGAGFNESIFYDRKCRKREDVCRIVFAGKISREKGVESLLRSIEIVARNRKGICLTLAGGNGDEKELERIRREAGSCSYQTVFTGRIPQESLAEIYSRSKVFALPSFYEGLPLTVMEALACGCRVVVTDLPGIRPFFDTYVPEAPVFYVKPPALIHTDEPVKEELPGFEERLAQKIEACIRTDFTSSPDLSGVSWRAVCQRILERERGSGSFVH